MTSELRRQAQARAKTWDWTTTDRERLRTEAEAWDPDPEGLSEQRLAAGTLMLLDALEEAEREAARHRYPPHGSLQWMENGEPDYGALSGGAS